ncbi:MAG: VWA domain-containing protein [Phycisphaerae bacterium]|nr:VWA domain-containing protein [Phycisphaerae bacterium]
MSKTNLTITIIATLGILAAAVTVMWSTLGCDTRADQSFTGRAAPGGRDLAGKEAADSRLGLEQRRPAASYMAPMPMGEGEAPAGFNTESYDFVAENGFLAVGEHPLSTFSIDVDTASYSNIRRFLARQGHLPPPGAVRIEEMINYFDYDYAGPEGSDPFAVHVDLAGCPWAPKHRLARIGLKGREIDADKRPLSNLVFLLDVSGSMRSAHKLDLVKKGMKLLVENLTENDSVAIVVYAGSSGLVLPATNGDDKAAIVAALDKLSAGGSTAGGAGITLAYKVARENYIDGGCNRVILCTDGDFNVGITDHSRLIRLIQDKAASGVFLSVLGFGTGNYKDSRMEKLADKGNGNYAYVDSLAEARKVLVRQISGTLVTIAKDVKIQVEFNPAKVAGYRLIGYENRLLNKEDFNDDTKDAGEIGAGHTVTALYEIVPAGVEVPSSAPPVDELKYQPGAEADDPSAAMVAPVPVSDETMTVKLRYKQPDGETSRKLVFAVTDDGATLADASEDFRFAAAVAAFGMLLRDSEHAGSYTYAGAAELGAAAVGDDRHGYRKQFVELVNKADALPDRVAGR